MIEIKSEFSRLDRLLFGPLFGLFTGMISAALVYKWQLNQLAMGLAIGALVLIAVYYLVPSWQTRIYRGWLLAFFPLGFIVSHLLLALLYYGLVTPIGFVMRLRGYDPLQRKLDPKAESYWQSRAGKRSAKDYFRQY